LSGVEVDLGAAIFNYDSTSFTATWDLGGFDLPLEAGFYDFVLSDAVASTQGGLSLDGDGDGNAGGDFTNRIYVAIPGDANLDGDVDVNDVDFSTLENNGDLSIVKRNLGLDSGGSWSIGDFNGDGDIDVNEIDFSTLENNGDLSILYRNLGRNVVPSSGFSSGSSFERDADDTGSTDGSSGLNGPTTGVDEWDGDSGTVTRTFVRGNVLPGGSKYRLMVHDNESSACYVQTVASSAEAVGFAEKTSRFSTIPWLEDLDQDDEKRGQRAVGL